MKTLSGTFRFVVLGVIVTVVVVSCCTFCPFPLIKDTKSYLESGHSYVELGHKLHSNIGKRTYRTYVEWKNKGDFDKALAQIVHNGGKICICVLMSSGDTPHPHELNNDCPRTYKCPSENIRTVKVTKSKVANDIAAGGSAVNDPHATYRIQSADPGDIINVLNALK
jgi:hypothetical protein